MNPASYHFQLVETLLFTVFHFHVFWILQNANLHAMFTNLKIDSA